MSLQAPILDDWKFQQIVDESKRRIGVRCPEWTDHNVSDPGVTLIELFSWMTELMLYRMNQVPERNYVKFLEMLGIALAPPLPAQTELRFRLSRNINDEPGEETNEITLPAREVVAATIRTEFTEAVEFATDAPLRLSRPKLSHVFFLPGEQTTSYAMKQSGERSFAADLPGDVRWFRRDGEPVNNGRGADGKPMLFPIFDTTPQQNDALWLGFTGEVAGNLVDLEWQCDDSSGATGMNPDNPAQVWEWWNPQERRWEMLEESIPDTTKGFNYPGHVELALPLALTQARMGGQRAYWIRCRHTLLTDELPLRGRAALAARNGRNDEGGSFQNERSEQPTRLQEYQASPTVRDVSARTTGGTAPASNCLSVFREEVGVSDGTPGQVFFTRTAPLLPRIAGETLRIGPSDARIDDMEAWTEVPDFAESGPTDRHFTCDSLTGEIRFGPALPTPSGEMQKYGHVPPKGSIIIFAAYRSGGGLQGNVQENQIRILKAAHPYITDVTNPRRATGGQAGETLAHAKLRAQALLRIRDRAVTGEDFEYLAKQGSTSVGRARCLPPPSDGVSDGVVHLRLVPTLPINVGVPTPLQLQLTPRIAKEVGAYLNERRLLTTVLDISAPEYVFISSDVSLMAAPNAETETVRRLVKERLDAFVHPLTGGPKGDGWPFEQSITIADLYAQIQQVPGVALLLGVPKLFVSYLTNASEGILGREEPVSLEEGVPLAPGQIFCTRSHRIQVRPMTSGAAAAAAG